LGDEEQLGLESELNSSIGSEAGTTPHHVLVTRDRETGVMTITVAPNQGSIDCGAQSFGSQNSYLTESSEETGTGSECESDSNSYQSHGGDGLDDDFPSRAGMDEPIDALDVGKREEIVVPEPIEPVLDVDGLPVNLNQLVSAELARPTFRSSFPPIQSDLAAIFRRFSIPKSPDLMDLDGFIGFASAAGILPRAFSSKEVIKSVFARLLRNHESASGVTNPAKTGPQAGNTITFSQFVASVVMLASLSLDCHLPSSSSFETEAFGDMLPNESRVQAFSSEYIAHLAPPSEPSPGVVSDQQQFDVSASSSLDHGLKRDSTESGTEYGQSQPINDNQGIGNHPRHASNDSRAPYEGDAKATFDSPQDLEADITSSLQRMPLAMDPSNRPN